MNNHIVMFSGGKGSFYVASFLKEKYPNDNIVLYFTDVLWEDEDLYRFINEVSDKLKLPMLIHSEGINPKQLMILNRFMFNSRVGNCSKILKMRVSSRFLKKGIKPPFEEWRNKNFLKNEDFTTNANLYFGIGYDESHRTKAIVENWKPFDVKFPLIEEYLDENDYFNKYNIKKPRLYGLGFAHNNCGGRCIKAGQGHFRNLIEKLPKRFDELMEFEIILSDYIRYTKQSEYDRNKDYMIGEVLEYATTSHKTYKLKNILEINEHSKNFNFGKDSNGEYIKKPYKFLKSKELLDIKKQPKQCSLLDIGGCGCFVEYEEEE